MRPLAVNWSRKFHLAGILWVLQTSNAEAGSSKLEASPHCLLQRSQQTQRRADLGGVSADLHEQGRGVATPQQLQESSKTLSFVQVASHAASWQESKRKLVLDPSFFGSFTDAETTFDEDGRNDMDKAANPGAVSGDSENVPTIEPPQWFHESASAGPKEAWQTYDLETEDASWRAKSPEWHPQGFGRYEQGWDPVDSREQGNADREDGKEAAWFDTVVDQYDLFGRPRAPSPESAKFYVEWSKLSRTAEWGCGPPGCVANTSLKVFENASEMEYKMCQLSVLVHATDFDDQYGREKIEWIVINGKEAVRDFSPQAPKGCETNDNLAELRGSDVRVENISNSSLLSTASFNGSVSGEKRGKKQDKSVNSTARGSAGAGTNTSRGGPLLYPCIRDMPLQGLIGQDGELRISGKISPAVDECPVNGNHLSGVVTVNCFARPIRTVPPTTRTTTQELVTTTPLPDFKMRDSKHFGCEVPGCTATVTLSVDDFNLTSRKCELTVRINQTDFDEQDGTSEQLEWIKVAGHNVTGKMKPGKNACQEASSKNQSRRYESFTVLDKKVVGAVEIIWHAQNLRRKSRAAELGLATKVAVFTQQHMNPTGVAVPATYLPCV